MQKEKVIIVGAGIAGLSLAIQLAGQGIPCVVIEARERFGAATSGVRISAEGVWILEKMSIRDIGENTEKLIMYFGRRKVEFNVKNRRSDSPAVIVTRLAVFEKLRQRIKELGIEIICNFQFDNVIERTDGVEAISKDGQRVKGGYLVGADGVGSRVRQLLNPGANSGKRYAGYLGVGFIFPGHQKVEMSLFTNINGNIGLGSIGKIKPGDDYNNNFLWTHIHMTESKAEAMTDKEVYDQITNRAENWPSHLQEIFETCKVNPKTVLLHQPVYNGGVPNNWYSNKMLLIGDAAHPYGPGGQGISMALKDAEALCEMFTSGITEEGKLNFQMTRAAEAKSKGERAEERNKPENQVSTEFGLFIKYLTMKTIHLFKGGKVEL